MKVQFSTSTKPLPGHLADVQIILQEAGLHGLVIAGTSLWQRAEGGIDVRFPRLTYGRGPGERHFYILQGSRATRDSLRDRILADYFKKHPHLSRTQVAGGPGTLPAAPPARDPQA